MSVSEFTLISDYFARRGMHRSDVVLGIGDDCALLTVPPGQALAVTLDTLVAGRHFFPEVDPISLGHKVLAVNLSDLAAMGAEPAWATLALTLPDFDPDWLNGFCTGLFSLAKQHGVQLVGGDTTRGPLSITLQAHGFVPPEQALRRCGARVGDAVFVTGTLGDAAFYLQQLNGITTVDIVHRHFLQQRLERPTPRLAQSLALRGLASSAIDLSDGLAQDLGHILRASGLGARLWLDRLPYSEALADAPSAAALAAALGGGDDYELCVTVPPAKRAQALASAAHWDCRFTEIGVIEVEPGLRCIDRHGKLHRPDKAGYDHFGSDT